MFFPEQRQNKASFKSKNRTSFALSQLTTMAPLLPSALAQSTSIRLPKPEHTKHKIHIVSLLIND